MSYLSHSPLGLWKGGMELVRRLAARGRGGENRQKRYGFQVLQSQLRTRQAKRSTERFSCGFAHCLSKRRHKM